MIYSIEVKIKEDFFDSHREGLKRDILDLGISSVQAVEVAQIYFLKGEVSEKDLKKICINLLTDPLTQEFKISASLSQQACSAGEFIFVVAYNPGVMDPWEESTLKGIRDLGIEGIEAIRTAKKYVLKGILTQKELNFILDKLLVNKTVQHILAKDTDFIFGNPEYKFKLITVDILSADKKKLREISLQGQLFLNDAEMFQIKKYFEKIRRNPTDCELETIAQTWSEHCKHKTLRGRIEYREVTSNQRRLVKKINNLLKETIMKVTEELHKPWCVSVFKDNSGVIRFDEDYNICFKVETHNHPSALEPYGGANTGIGGVIRDPLGTGLGAKPIANTDVFCFGPPDYPYGKLPPGTLHPKRIMKGVVAGVRDYGNKMGIPTVNGAVIFDECYIGNPLVYCGTIGLIPKDKSFKKVVPGDLIVLVGGRTGRDGIHGATFSSAELTVESEKISASAVQMGNPITEKKMVDTLLKARDLGLYHAITDCGGGGLSSAVGEMGENCGARVDLDKVPLKYKGLSYTEIWISEAQERMILAVPEKNLDRLLEIFEQENVEASVIGEFTNDKHLRLFYTGNLVCDLEMEFLHHGLPDIVRKAVWEKKKFPEPRFPCPEDLNNILLKILSSYNVCSKEWIIRQYDHEVQGGSVIKPLVGINNDGPSDAAVIRPRLDSPKGIVISCGINPKYGEIDPYWMAGSCIDEALRQIIAVGGSLKEVAILDNFCWGNTNKPDRLGSLVRCAFGCYTMAKDYGVPFISGKDSLNNEYKIGKKSISIPGTLLISAIGIIEDVSHCITLDLKNPKNLIYIVGETFPELGGSEYYHLLGYLGNSVPQVNPKKGRRLMEALSRAINKGLVLSCHDCSEGGIGVTLAEMAFSGGWGMEIFLGEVPYKIKNLRNDFILFSESNTRFIVEVERKKKKEFEKELRGIPLGLLGCVSEDRFLKIYGVDGKMIICLDIDTLKEAWQSPLKL
ncbi:MAG: phosphoribosylformylglycinamidine synthase subunit PurL [Candidatus Omnitrophica bacterium]|nr:phosphoribosylformylglycinamidine synthase subunit PurL [Candidatus Omnitrophota bacterium]